MIEKILKAKHWQIFIVAFAVPFIVSIALYFITIISIVINNHNNDPLVMLKIFNIMPILVIITCVPVYLWYWSIGIGLQKQIPENLKLNTNTFKICFLITLLFPIILSCLFAYIFSDPENFLNFVSPIFVLYLVPLYIIAFLCSIYNMYFIAKTLKTAELKKQVKFGEFVGEFFIVMFYYVGIWVLQPKINEIIKGGSNINNETNNITYSIN